MGLCCCKGVETNPETQRFQKIPDKFNTIEEVQKALRQAGLEACQLIVGIDFTKSNTWTGEVSFNGKPLFVPDDYDAAVSTGQNLHSIHGPPNPYLSAISLIARTLEDFDDDHLIPCYGFGDSTTGESSVFSLYPGNRPANGLQALVQRYRELVPHVSLSGPTSFAPLIRQAMRHVYHNGMEFHLLLIIADGQISSTCMQETMRAIEEASMFPISIVLIGVGDGPWDAMRYFDDSLPSRQWDNFQFVEFDRVLKLSASIAEERREASFALNALMELPDQYKIAEHLTGTSAQERVKDIVASIPPSILKDPPMHFSAERDLPSAPPPFL